jgi:NADP-dependent 3-hydroxy acid dehydrogenase YdfG
MGRLDETVALVTGASSGIGAATALALADAGSTVVVVARRLDRLEALVERITTAGGRALALECDVTDRVQVERAISTTIEQFGRLDTVVANAGIMLLGPAVDADYDEWDRMVAVNIAGLMYTARAALPHLTAAAATAPREVADLVLVSSGAGRRVHAGSAMYAATKHAVGALGEGLRQEMASKQVRVGLVEPGNTDSELASHLKPEILAAARARWTGVTNLGAEDVAECIVYMVTRPRHVAMNEVLIRPTTQA